MKKRSAVRKGQGDPVKVIKDCTKRIGVSPRDASAYFSRGVARGKLGDTAGAIEDYTKTIELDPKHAEAYLNRGLERLSKGYAELCKDGTNPNEHAQKDPVYGDRGFFDIRPGVDEAIADFTKAIELDPKNAEAYTHRGIARSERQVEGQQAIEDYTKAIEINPQQKLAYYNRGLARFREDDTELLLKAIEDYSKVIKIDPKFVPAYYNRALAQVKQGDKSGAIEDFSKFVELAPKAAAKVLYGVAAQRLKS